jgi:hypothetical protein
LLLIHRRNKPSAAYDPTERNVMRDFGLPPRRKRDLRSSEILRSVELQSRTDVSGQHIGLILKGLLKMEPTGCPETSVRDYNPTLRKISEERKSNI